MGNEQSSGFSPDPETFKADLERRKQEVKKKALELHNRRKVESRRLHQDGSKQTEPPVVRERAQNPTEENARRRDAYTTSPSAPKERNLRVSPSTNRRSSYPDTPSLAGTPNRPQTNIFAAPKRPAPATEFTRDHPSSHESLPKIAKRKSDASSRPPLPTDSPLTAVGNERPPIWYRDLPMKNVRGKNDSNADTLLLSLRTQIDKCQKPELRKDKTARTQIFTLIRDKLHKMAFLNVSASVLKSNRMLHDTYGLPRLFDEAHMKGVDLPFDIKADARELYNKWCRRVFDDDMFRGIIFKVKTAERKRDGQKTTDSIDPDYVAVSANYHGNGDLLNGQWWPTQLCALRDGAHGSSQAGIHGHAGDGAFSCIMSGGHDYPDIDNGDEVFYCGTDSTDGEITGVTQRMLESVEHGKAIRLIRSHNLGGEFAPVLGFRYDGLYNAVSFEQLDGAGSTRQRHRFRLVRRSDQDPVRGGSGAERRPTQEEVRQFNDYRHNAGKATSKARAA